MKRQLFSFLFFTFLINLVLFAQENAEQSPQRLALKADCKARFLTRSEQAKGNPHLFVAPGIFANATNRTITLDAFTTGVAPGDVAEFFLITANSGHSYESLLMTYAKADDLCRALEFIGIPRGRSVNYDRFQFWPKGEQVQATVSFSNQQTHALSTLMIDQITQEPLQINFVYTGDRRNESGAFIGDSTGPGSLISCYNEPITVLDIPRFALQSEVYENFLVGPRFPTNENLYAQITLTAEARPTHAPKRVQTHTFHFTPSGVVTNPAAATPIAPIPLSTLLKAFQGEPARLFDYFVQPAWDDALTLGSISEMCKILNLLDTQGGLRIEPPVPGDAYYKAFIPNAAWKERAQRPTQPCELRLQADGSASLVAIEEIWKDGEIDPELKTTEIAQVTPAALPKLLLEKKPDLAVILIFAPKETPYRLLKPFLSAVLPTHPNLYVFAE